MESKMYDRVEVHTGVTVQVLIDTRTGESSIAWTRDEDMIEDMIRQAHVVTLGK